MDLYESAIESPNESTVTGRDLDSMSCQKRASLWRLVVEKSSPWTAQPKSPSINPQNQIRSARMTCMVSRVGLKSKGSAANFPRRVRPFHDNLPDVKLRSHIVVLALLAAVLAGFLYSTFHSNEPRCDGQNLSFWLREIEASPEDRKSVV